MSVDLLTGTPSPRPLKLLDQVRAAIRGRHYSLRGATLHTQPCVRRPSLRRGGLPGDSQRLAGLRLVFPPAPG